MTVNIKRTVLYCGSVSVDNGRVIFSSTVTASPVKLTNDVETLLSRSIGSRIRKKVEQKKTSVELPLSTKIFFIS